MNRNHLKTIAVVLGLLAVVAVAAAAAQSTDPKPFIGAWKGTLSVAGMDLEIGLNFTLDEAKKIRGPSIRSPRAGSASRWGTSRSRTRPSRS